MLAVLAITGVGMAIYGKSAIWALIAVFAAIMDLIVLWSVQFNETKLKDTKGKGKNAAFKKTFNSITEISQEDIKQLLIQYRVKKEHVPIVIDSYAKEHVRHSPAYLWKNKGYLHLLVMEEKPRNIAVPLSDVEGIVYLRNVAADVKYEYETLRKPSFLNLIFQEYLPVYAERQKDGKKIFTKNLYSIAPGIQITNTSIKNANKILHLPISFEGALDSKYSYFYKEAYRMKVLLIDKVLTAADYKEQIGRLLKQMADETEDVQKFAFDLERMVRARLVTREVADYYMGLRQRQKRDKK